MMKTPKNEREKFLLKCSVVLQAAVIVLCILVMLLCPDYRFHPVVVLYYAATVLVNNLASIGRQ